VIVTLTILHVRAWLADRPRDLDYDQTLEVLRKL
jgi:hypothetical protein